MTFGERLRSLREDNDEKQKDIAKILFVSSNMISAYELGKHFPKNENSLKELAKHFNVSLDYLLGYSDVQRYNAIEKFSEVLRECEGLTDDKIQSVVNYIKFVKAQ